MDTEKINLEDVDIVNVVRVKNNIVAKSSIENGEKSVLSLIMGAYALFRDTEPQTIREELHKMVDAIADVQEGKEVKKRRKGN